MMNYTLRLTLGAAFAVLIATTAACAPSAPGTGADALVTTDACTAGQTRCVGTTSYQTCQNDVFVESESCQGAQVCDPALACVDCRPSRIRTCSGDEVHTCNQDGTIGDLVETCDFESCSNGSCGGGDNCSAQSQLIYLVDDSYRLWSFDPRLLPPSEPFKMIGSLNCPAGAPWPEWGGDATPFSMSVDRDANAWVLYASGEIFKVSTTDASCTGTNFGKGQQGFKLFGMSFVSDTSGGDAETLFIAGGPVDASGAGNLGSVDPTTLMVTKIGPHATAEYSPELTGTGEGKLYGYFPGVTSSSVAEMNKATGGNLQSWPLTPLTGTVRAWAFAHWGGKFYIFITTSTPDPNNPLGTIDKAQVVLLDPATGVNSVISGLDNTGKIIVGAGVSTCAPVYVP